MPEAKKCPLVNLEPIPKLISLMKMSEVGLDKDEGKNARRRALRHVEDIFTRRRSQGQLQPFVIGMGFGIGS